MYDLNQTGLCPFPWQSGTSFPRKPPGFAEIGRRWAGLTIDGLAFLIGDIFQDAPPESPTVVLEILPTLSVRSDENWALELAAGIVDLGERPIPLECYVNTVLSDFFRNVLMQRMEPDRSFQPLRLGFHVDGAFWEE